MQSKPAFFAKLSGITDLKHPLSKTISIFLERIEPVSIKIIPSSEGLFYLEWHNDKLFKTFSSNSFKFNTFKVCFNAIGTLQLALTNSKEFKLLLPDSRMLKLTFLELGTFLFFAKSCS